MGDRGTGVTKNGGGLAFRKTRLLRSSVSSH